jgi:(p)ppGpp synthase/HD superfamily hydrolase
MDVHMWQRAISFAARAHEGQRRKDGVTPYAAHPIRVAMTVRTVFGCEDEVALAAACLHDVIEDCDVDFDEIAEEFGEPVARCVAALSKDMRLPESEREPSYDEGLRRADWRAKLIKLGDVYDNFCDKGSEHGKILDRCARALAIARAAREEHPALGRGIEAVEGLMRRASGG